MVLVGGYLQSFIVPLFSFDHHPAQHGRSHKRSGATEETIVGNYKLLKTIGKGNFAKVKLARHLPTNKEVSFCLVLVVALESAFCTPK